MRLTYARAERARRRARARAARRRPAQGRPGRHLGAQLRRVGARPVRDREGRDHPRQRQPGVPHDRARSTRSTSRAAGCSSRRRAFKTSRLRGDDRGGPRRAARARARGAARLARVGGAARRRRSRRRDLRRARPRDDPINIQYTSGTTGFPKGATLSHHNILNNGFFVGEGCGYTEHDRVCIPVPFYHCFGMVMGNLGCTTHGACMVVPERGLRARGACSRRSQDERCTSLYGVPTMFIAELDHPRLRRVRPVQSLRTGIMAGSPCPIEVMKQVIERDAHGRGDHLLRHDRDVAGVDPDRRRTTRSSGASRPSGACTRTSRSRSIDPATGRDRRRAASRASCCTRGYSVMAGYWNDPERTAEAIDDAGWMHTGDLATMDDGRLREHRRPHRRTWSSAAARTSTRARSRSSCTPTRPCSRRAGHRRARRALRRGADGLRSASRRAPSSTRTTCATYCEGRIAHFKVPRYVRFVDEFPMTVTGKVQKYKMREQAIDELGLQRAAHRVSRGLAPLVGCALK